MNACRLCNGQTRYLWRQSILGKFDVPYFECEQCGSLQTEAPYWLEEAYSASGTGLDTGACQRSLQYALIMSAALELLGFGRDRECLDYGAGLGLYARMMRDRGWNYLAHDKYVLPFYMDRYRADPKARTFALVSAFEVFEHLPNPAQSFETIIGAAQDYVFFATELWKRQGNEWHYLAPAHGQHVFFYTQAALELAGRRHQYEFHDLGFIKCFARTEARDKVALLRRPDFGRVVFQSFMRHQENAFQYALKDNAELLRSPA